MTNNSARLKQISFDNHSSYYFVAWNSVKRKFYTRRGEQYKKTILKLVSNELCEEELIPKHNANRIFILDLNILSNGKREFQYYENNEGSVDIIWNGDEKEFK